MIYRGWKSHRQDFHPCLLFSKLLFAFLVANEIISDETKKISQL